MKITCSKEEKKKLILLIKNSNSLCRRSCLFYNKCDFNCEETLEMEIEWEVKEDE